LHSDDPCCVLRRLAVGVRLRLCGVLTVKKVIFGENRG
jgi:hypothetical protein